MAHYRKIDSRIWNDAKFRALSKDGKLAFMFILTHPHMTALGAMRATLAGLSAEIGWPEKAFRDAFQEALSRAMVKHDTKASLVWLPNFLRYNRPENPNVAKAWKSAIEMLPECSLKLQVIQGARYCVAECSEKFREALPKDFLKDFGAPLPKQEQEQEQEPEQEQESSSSPTGDVSEPRVPSCPHEQIIDLYHKRLPTAPMVNLKLWGGTRARHLQARWREDKDRQNLEWWDRFFQHINTSDFLCGRSRSTNGRPPFHADLEWIVTLGNFVKIHEGARYFE